MGSGPSSPSSPTSPSSPSSPSTPSTPSTPNTSTAFNKTNATSSPFTTTQYLTIGQISDSITAPNPLDKTTEINFSTLIGYITNTSITNSISTYRATTLKTLMSYTGTNQMPIQYTGWAFHINSQTVVGNNTTTYYSYIVVPASLSTKVRFVPTITLVHNGASSVTTNVRVALYDNFTTGTAAYANNGIGANTQRYLSAAKSVTVPTGGTGASIQFNELIPSYYANSASAINAFVAIGISDGSVQWKPSFTFAIQYFGV